MKKQCLALSLIAIFSFIHPSNGDPTALEPSFTKEEKWERYEKNRLRKKGFLERIAECFEELHNESKHSFLWDVLFYKNNRVETPFAKEIAESFDRSLDDITILSKPLRIAPTFRIFNTIVIDHDKIAEFTKEEQAFLLGHEITNLKNKYKNPLVMIAAAGLFTIGNCSISMLLDKVDPGFSAFSFFFNEICILPPLLAKLSRWQVKQADITSAKTLNLAAAGASALKKILKKWICRQEVPLNPNGILHYLRTGGILNMLNPYPSLLERIANLEELAKEQALEA